MRKLLSQAGALALAAGVGLAAAGCTQINVLKGQMALRDAVTAYQRQDYREAIEKYEEALELNPDLGDAYFYLGNSYDNLYRPSRAGEPENDQLLHKAVENYTLATEKAENPITKERSYQFLVAVYGPEKLNDPTQQEPLLRKMIEMDPSDPGNYFYLANVHEQNGNYEDAEQLLLKAREVAPRDATVHTTLAGFYNRQGEFDKTMDALRARADLEPNNPEAFYTMATFYWEKAAKDFTISQAERLKYLQEGYKAIDRAIELKPDYFEALTYKNLLLRQEALLIKDPKRQQELLREADQFRDRAIDTRAKQTAGAE